MQLEAIQQSGAEPYERNEARTAQRNGYKERSLKTHVDELILKKPQLKIVHLNPVFLINILVWK
jgi:transposase-like protein